MIIVAFILGVAFIKAYVSDIYTVLLGYSDYVKEGGSLNKFTSGRFLSFIKYVDLFLSHPFIGNGPNYEHSRAHNIFIDLLYQNGILGFFLFCIAIFNILKLGKIAKNSNNQSLLFLYIHVSVSIICSLGEISFFTNRVCDLLFIPAVVLLYKEAKCERNRKINYVDIRLVN